MRQPKGKTRVHDTVMLSGWLFADLLLALAVIFLAANTVGIKPKPIPTPTPRPIVSPTPTQTPTPTPEPRLDFAYHRITLTNVDFNGLLNNSSSAINDVEQQLRSQNVLHGRSVGLAIVYGGAPTDGDITQAFAISDKVYAILRSLGHSNFAFQRASYYDHLYVLGNDPGTVVIDVFLFKQ
jgi:hypothetical protein